MRNTFADEITKLGSSTSHLVLLSGDIGNRLFDKFKENQPDRFFNCGVAEANMMTVAAGMALSGIKPFVYTITPFITTRCLEQIRVDVCYHRAAVVIVGTGSGLSYANLGSTHHSCEDIAFLRSIPEMTVVCPGDPYEVRAVLREAIQYPKPLYIRLGKKGEPQVHDEVPPFTIGKAIKISAGDRVCILANGVMLHNGKEAAATLTSAGISTALYSFHTVKPLDEETLREVFSQFDLVVTVEEHSKVGGLGSAVAEWFVQQRSLRARPLSIATPDSFFREAGGTSHAREMLGLSTAKIVKQVERALG